MRSSFPKSESFHFKMLLHQVTLLLIFITTSTAQVNMTSSFRRLGYLATTTTTSHDEKELIATLRPQLEVASKTINDLQALFFETDQHHRPKRQLLMGLGMLLGLTSLGTSIYSARELQQLHGELTNLKTDSFATLPTNWSMRHTP